MRFLLIMMLAIPFALAGCAHHHPKRKAHVHVHGHHHSGIVVVHTKPSPKRHCRFHNDHWDCHR